ncbi:MAG TPA: hypothetical protein DCS82_02990 [Rhodospirillaceae bacterium]|nr:hypothetical protein [Rhodospirillaceae bacterium]HAT34657.1 hypothetical protein [Rhodospirillaceae bacterium]
MDIADKLKNKLQPVEKKNGVAQNTAPSILSADLHIQGDIEGDGEVHIEGRIDGNVSCEQLTVGRAGHIKGKIHCKEASIHGQVIGALSANDVELAETAEVTGDVNHETLSVKPGAVVNGFYKHTDSKSLADRKVKALVARKPGSRPKVSRPKRSRIKKSADTAQVVGSDRSDQAKEDTVH